MALARKQQIMLVVTIVAFAFVLWQLYDIFGFGGSNASQPATQLPSAIPTATVAVEKPAVVSEKQTEDQILQNVGSSSIATASPQAVKPVQHSVQPAPLAASANGQQLPQQAVQETLPLTAAERQYLDLANQLQLLKMQRQIIEQQEAIAQARKKLSELGGSSGSSDLEAVSTPSHDLNLVYMDYQEGRWTATINLAGRFFEVENGTTLIDGSRVSRIDRNGVVLTKDGMSNLLTFVGLMPLAQTKPVPAAVPHVEVTRQPMGVVQQRKPVRHQQQPSTPIAKPQVRQQPSSQQIAPTSPGSKVLLPVPATRPVNEAVKKPQPTAVETKATGKKPATTSTLAPVTVPEKKMEAKERVPIDKPVNEAVKKPQPTAVETKATSEKPATTSVLAPVTIPEKKVDTGKQILTDKPGAKPAQQSQVTSDAKGSELNPQKTAAQPQTEQAEWTMVTPQGEEQIKTSKQSQPQVQTSSTKPGSVSRPAKGREAGNYQQLMNILQGTAADNQQDSQRKTPDEGLNSTGKTTTVNHSRNVNDIRLTAKEAQTFAELEEFIAENNQVNSSSGK